jgi:carboxyl-terminal processing protease
VRLPAPARRRFLRGATALLLAGPSVVRATPASPAADFDAFCRAIDEGYAYLDRPADWKAARARWRPKAAAAKDRAALIAALEGLIAELEDPHVGLDAHNPGSPRPVPAATDLWGEWVDGEARLAAVRAGSVADSVGLHPGQRVVSVGGVAVEAAVRASLPRPRQSDPAARNYALCRLLAGPWAGMLSIEAHGAAGVRRYDVERSDAPPGALPPIIARRIGEDRDLGYLRLKNNLGDPGLVAHFDAALGYLKDTRGLLIDLRETQGGGSPAVAVQLLARFAKAETPWIVRRPRGAAAPTTQRVAPRGPFTYESPVAVLVDRWTAGEGESLAIGLAAVSKATLVGTPMAGLRGELREVRLPGSGLVAHFPGAKVARVNGPPRESVRPAHAVDLAAPSGGPGDPILYQGLKLLEANRPGSARRS